MQFRNSTMTNRFVRQRHAANQATKTKTRLLLMMIFIAVVVLVSKMQRSQSEEQSSLSSPQPLTAKTKVEFTPEETASLLLKEASTPVRVFGPSTAQTTKFEDSDFVSFRFYTQQEIQLYIQQHGPKCWKDSSMLWEKFVSLSSLHQVELWKYCVMYLGHGNVYMEADNVALLQDLHDILLLDVDSNSIGNDSVAISVENGLIHGSLLKWGSDKEHLSVAREMIQTIMTTPESKLSRDFFMLQQTLGDLISGKENWTLWQAACRELGGDEEITAKGTAHIKLQESVPQTVQERMLQALQGGEADARATADLPTTLGKPSFCPVLGGYCCHAVNHGGVPLFMLRHPGPTAPWEALHASSYMATVRQRLAGHGPLDSPSFFDVALQNDCLDATMTCHKCLKSTKMGSCQVCKDACPCYCNILCKIRPPSKPITKIYEVQPPLFKKNPERLVPRIVHQTWYEPVTPEKYPNMSRLIESWRRSGWEYNFYNDDMAAAFLSEHFPPEVREAYDAILPGAFKADLFRYCVLLIRGGVYADMDVLLEANLDQAVAPDIGFMTPIDEPGIKVGHRSCLWNGLLAVAPGHVFLAKTIEMVVNHIRNRFTSIDYDDMLCPNPALSVSHTVDTLFTCGPCILGAAINSVLNRHLQSEYEIGDVDLFKSSETVHPDDPRLRIPGRTVILKQNKQDMGAHRFTWEEKSLIVAATDMPDYDDRPPDVEHYSKTHEKVGVYGLKKLYKDSKRANEEIQIVVMKPQQEM